MAAATAAARPTLADISAVSEVPPSAPARRIIAAVPRRLSAGNCERTRERNLWMAYTHTHTVDFKGRSFRCELPHVCATFRFRMKCAMHNLRERQRQKGGKGGGGGRTRLLPFAARRCVCIGRFARETSILAADYFRIKTKLRPFRPANISITSSSARLLCV